MGLTIVVLDNNEEFIRFLDPELCTLVETHEKDGYRSLDFTYTYQILNEDKALFKMGNKVWIQGDNNLSDCLYVVNTPVTEDIYQENSFHVDLEEVLVELNYAPLFTQTELTAGNGFSLSTTNGKQEVRIDWNALNYWFGAFYNIGVVQNCIGEHNQKISFTGTMTLMGLLRYIEEETGNVFVTRYEKDCLNNTIHRYLDYLNPTNVNKPWVLNLEYTFVDNDTTIYIYDEDGNPTTDDNEDVYEEEDIVKFDDLITETNIDPTDTVFRLTDGTYVLNTDGKKASEDDDLLQWTSEDIGLTDDIEDIAICLEMKKNVFGMTVNERTFAVCGTGDQQGNSYISTDNDKTEIEYTNIPDDCYFEIYDTSKDLTVFRTQLNRAIGHVHEEVLDFGFNLENITHERDETETFTAISPILSLEDMEGLSRTDMATIINNWRNLSISKGDTIPMIVEKVNVNGASLSAATTSLGTKSTNANYYNRPLKPQDNTDSNDKSYEFYRATAYWRAPFTKRAGALHVEHDRDTNTEYKVINGRTDSRLTYGVMNKPKMGTVETSDEDVYAIYNDVAMKLKDKMYPQIDIDVDVANLRDKKFNDYELHDKVYIKMPDTEELVTARVVKTSKEAHDVAKNTVELSNYSNLNIKNIQFETLIEASNTSFKYPNTKELSVRLVNLDYDDEDEYSVHYPANKLITFHLYKVENGNATITTTTYTKITDAYGYAKISMNYEPGEYELHISFGGDEEYFDTNATCHISVGGVKETVKGVNTSKKLPSDLAKKTTKAKTTKKTSKATTTISTKRYYSKYGVSPDGKYLMAIGRPSAGGELSKYGYKFYKVVFVRKCPFCGSKELYWNIFWTGNESGSWGTNPAVNRKKSGSAEGEITCKKCDADFSIFGKDKATTPRKTLKVHKKAVKCNKTDAYTLKKGKMYYDTITKENKQKKVTSEKTRTKTANDIPKKLEQLALNIVGNSEGLAAAKKIAAWCQSRAHLNYDYYGDFIHTPSSVLNRGKANCCDSARFMMTLMDAAGCTEKLKLQYVHVCCKAGTTEGHVFCKITTRSTGVWRYVDPVLKSRAPWGHYCGTNGSPPGNVYDYAYNGSHKWSPF